MTDTLIQRLEAAEGGSRELDAAIGVHLSDRECSSAFNDHGCGPGTFWEKFGHVRSLRIAPHYTTSLDAIISLVESDGGFLWEIGTAECEAIIIWETQPSYWNERAVGESYQADGTTFNPALSMCIAFFTALKARKAVG